MPTYTYDMYSCAITAVFYTDWKVIDLTREEKKSLVGPVREYISSARVFLRDPDLLRSLFCKMHYKFCNCKNAPVRKYHK